MHICKTAQQGKAGPEPPAQPSRHSPAGKSQARLWPGSFGTCLCHSSRRRFRSPTGCQQCTGGWVPGRGALQVSQCAHLLAGKSIKGVFLRDPVGIPSAPACIGHWPQCWSGARTCCHRSTQQTACTQTGLSLCTAKVSAGRRWVIGLPLKKPSSSGRPCGAWRLECCNPGTAKGSKMGQWLATAAAHVFAGAHCRVEGLLLAQACIAAVL